MEVEAGIGVEVKTGTTSHQYVTWWKSRLVGAIEDARRALGPAEQAQIQSARESLHGFDLNQPAETLNAEAREMFDIGDAMPTRLELRSLFNFLAADVQNDHPPTGET